MTGIADRRIMHTGLMVIFAVFIAVCVFPAETHAAKTYEVQVVSTINKTGVVSYNKKGMVTGITGEYYALKYTYTKSGKMRTVTEYDMGEKTARVLFKYKKGKIFKLVYTSYISGKTKTYPVKTDKYKRIVKIGDKCSFTYSKGLLKTARAKYSNEQETVKYTFKQNKKHYLSKIREKSIDTGASYVRTYKTWSKKGNVVKMRKARAGTSRFKYQTIQVKKKWLKTVKQQRRSIQYYQLERLTMDPIMYPLIWAADTELLTYYF